MRSSGLERQHSGGLDSEAPLFRAVATLPNVIKSRDSAALLKPGPLKNRPDVFSLDFVEGCGQACAFCPVRFNAQGQLFSQLRMAGDPSNQIAEELLDMPRWPKAVIVSPSTDPFPPLLEIQQETGKIVDVLARKGIETWLMTRGFIRPAILDVLRRNAALVKVTVAMTTLERPLQRMLEPLTAPPRLRLKNLRYLREAGVACTASLEPLIPGVTDTRSNLLPLLEALALEGIRSLTVGYLVVHQRNQQHLEAVLKPAGLDALVLDEYAGGPELRYGKGMAGRYLPRPRRQRGYAAVMAMAAGFGMRVSVNSLTNPDFSTVAPSAPRPFVPPVLQLNAG